MKNYLLIDGYNIINGWADLKEIGHLNLEEARDLLIEKLIEYKAYTGENITIVYDAHMVKGSQLKKQNMGGIEIIFTKEYQTADSYIEKAVENLTKNRKNRVRVATSDWAEQQIVLGSGATRISARELKIEIDQIHKNIHKKIQDKKTTRSPLEERLREDDIKALEKWRRNQ